MVGGTEITIRLMRPADRGWADRLIAGHQGSRWTARLGELLDPLELQGLVAERAEQRLGLATLLARDRALEIVTLNAATRGLGAGTALLGAAADQARSQGCLRVWLVTTNDNLEALAFYQRRGYRLSALHAGAVDADRALKPEIPLVNDSNGIGIHDLVELELDLGAPLSGR